MIKAVIFDMDGVLQDSETICDKVWQMVGEEMGLDSTDVAIQHCRGMNRTDTQIELKKIYGEDFDSLAFLNRCTEKFIEIENTTGVPLMPYAKECLSYLKPKYRIALASSTRGIHVKRQMTTGGLIGYFETLTTGDMVTHGKPDPEIYLMACNSLGLKPEECVAIEDSPNGIRSAVSAGMKAIMVPDKIQPDNEMKEKAWKIVDSLKDLKELL